ncbi:hypothetical protein BH23ACT10_BH23ACT10_12330 [soil metagenome]
MSPGAMDSRMRNIGAPRGAVRTAGWLAIATLPVAIASTAVTFVAAGGDPGVFDDPTIMLRAGAAEAVRWVWVTDLLAYYLMLVPAALLLHWIVRGRDPLGAGLAGAGAVTYLAAGALGAGLLAGAHPALVETYAAAGPGARPAVVVAFDAITGAVYGGLWPMVAASGGALWWLVAGHLLTATHPRLARLTQLLGAVSAIYAAAFVIGIDAVAAIALLVYLVGGPVWAVALGILLVRGRLTPAPDPTGTAREAISAM